jgi:hypothetical protein
MRNLIIYDGPSVIDGAPIVAILTGLANASSNPGTGDMLQIYIIRSDIMPEAARHTGADAAICGDCPMRGSVVSLDEARDIAEILPAKQRAQLIKRIKTAQDKGQDTINIERPCYVIVSQAPTIIYKAYQRGLYREATPEEAAQYVRGRALRIGAYGDSAALPIGVVEPLADAADTVTNYTHSGCYDMSRAKQLAQFTMLSADNLKQAKRYWKTGARTFRVSSDWTLIDGVRRVNDISDGESQCPKTISKKVSCIDCGLCDGLRRGIKSSIVAPAHGNGAAYHAAL